ncbi:MAG: T9SS type A sorting domain-containing protein [bacterium]
MNSLAYCGNYSQIKYLDRGLNDYGDIMGPFVTDYNKNTKEEIVIRHTNTINFYEYEEDSIFVLINEFYLDSVDLLWTAGIGDMDGDSLLEMLLRNPDINTIFIYEQSDNTSFFNTLTWTSDTVFKSIYNLELTDKLKGDEVDRIFGAGIPWLSTPTKGYGWYYFTCTGDNQYEVLNTFEEDTYCSSNMDIGKLDNDSMTDVVIPMYGNVKYFESVSIDDDSFEFISSKPVDGGIPLSTLILPDIDRDGRNEYMQYCVNYLDLSGYVSYGYVIMEDTSGTGEYDTIWRRDFNSVTDYIYVYAGDMDYGDIDGDNVNELVICGGRHIEVWDAVGDNQFERMWEWTDPTYYTIQSHIKCHDFNKNGIEEIVFSGCGESAGEECTRIFECDPTREPSAPEIVIAEANDGAIVGEGVDYDDYIRIEFEGLTNEPKLNKSNIDSILRLSGGDSYLANGKYLDTCRWEIEDAKSVLYIELTEIQASPTVEVGDTIYPDGITIKSFEYPAYAASKPIVISGSFGPTGIQENREPCALSLGTCTCTVPTIKSQYIIWNTNTEATLTVYDISGRELIKEESKTTGEHKTDIRHLKNGIYFIKLSTENQSITEKMVRIR